MTIKTLWELSRPLNSLITGLTVIVGGILAANIGTTIVGWTLELAGLSAALVAVGGNAINDAYDAAIDHLNRPERPIPSGRIGVDQAFLFGIALMIIGTGLGFSLSVPLGWIALVVSVLLWGYSAWWKMLPMIGNIVVALCGGLAFIYGAMAVGNPLNGLIPALFAFLIHLAREIVKDAEDESGDRACKARTLPIVIGIQSAQRIAILVLIVLIASTVVPYWIGQLGFGYLTIVMIGVDIPLIIVSIRLWHTLNRKELGQISSVLKWIMLIGLVSLYVG
ncbi:MAG: geranylgeranylglycerol-phosphate geranylgeranyltransferase [Candidatus Electryoneaceae bacterium]|nr:geranylgeranylglycerol-phosphate geranylgeranyltransferase [Candidatus Electryoneaceae bacterium]